MKLTRFVALAVLAAMLATLAPQAPVSADGAASTRNILLGAAAATLIIINHNKKVHEKYAEDAAAQASLAAQRDDAQAAFASEKKAYDSEAALVVDLKREVAYQHDVIEQQHRQLSALQPATGSHAPASNFVAQTSVVQPTPVGGSKEVAAVSVGWGSI